MAGTVTPVDPIIEGVLVTADAYWRVEAVRHGRTERWFRVWHATTLVAEKASLATVQRILGDAYATLQPAEDLEGPATVSS